MIFIGSKRKFFEKYVTREELEKATQELVKIKNDSNHYFKVGIGDTVYDVSYRNKDGKFSTDKKQASKDKSKVVAKKVTKSNFIYVQSALKSNEMFETEEAAKEFIKTLK